MYVLSSQGLNYILKPLSIPVQVVVFELIVLGLWVECLTTVLLGHNQVVELQSTTLMPAQQRKRTIDHLNILTNGFF
jgi:hypothetical protein